MKNLPPMQCAASPTGQFEEETDVTSRLSRRHMMQIVFAGVAAAALAMPSLLRAQDSFPNRPINVVVPFDTGG